ncbi:hypothetical protein [Stenotrophomonas maltophilia]|jgi:hypothetical protein|uniref:hypothetical protein n=1 Tax=Stenotrophomonas maltophilia TaxID=40324 RepID=UPI0039C29C31
MKKLGTLSATALLVACSGGPGSGDVEKALTAYFKEATGTTMTFERLKVGECVRGSVPGYACSVTGSARYQLGTRIEKQQLIGTFVIDKVDGTWTVVDRR